MLELHAYPSSDEAAVIADGLGAVGGVRHLVVGGPTVDGHVELTAEIDPRATDPVLAVLRAGGLAAEDFTLARVMTVRPPGWRYVRPNGESDATVWAEVAGRAAEHARPALAYFLYMVAAGVVAGVGVLTGSSILVVGAMALSPDLLPISAAAVGFVEGRWRLVVRALAALIAGLGVAILTASATTLVLRLSGRIDADLELASSVLGPSLTSVGPGSVLVALAAGMAGMLAYETSGRAAVGVAISVTTIPAAAYLGDAIALGGYDDGAGALGVLVTNVVCIVTAGTLTLLAQRRLGRWRTDRPA